MSDYSRTAAKAGLREIEKFERKIFRKIMNPMIVGEQRVEELNQD